MTQQLSHDRKIGSKAGYRKPPVEHQFRKGQSGNPKGRPRKNNQPLQAIVDAELRKTISVTQNGQRITMSCLQAIILKAVQDAMTGSPAERRLSLKFLAEHMPKEALKQQQHGFVVQLVKSDEDL